MMTSSLLRKVTCTALAAILFTGSMIASPDTLRTNRALAQCTCAGDCDPFVAACNNAAVSTSKGQAQKTNEFTTHEFTIHREWMVKVFFEMHILPAMMLFAEQISAMAMHQVVVIGSFLDAKHQLETQRLFQQMTAQAHKDYHPSEGMCTFGTNMRSLAASERNTDLAAAGFAKRGIQRELLARDGISADARSSDFLGRIGQFRSIYCDPNDNGKGLDLLCPDTKDSSRMNKDINFTATIDQPLTLKVDYTEEGKPDHKDNKSNKDVSADEEDIFALAANLYAHDLPPEIAASDMSDEEGVIRDGSMVSHYMNIRAITAKRSVARNSFASITALKAQGEKEVQPYLFALMKEMGVGAGGGEDAEKELRAYLGERPSYYAQMEVLTRKLYQNPSFYTELYDKPANVARKNVSMQAIQLMQKRDIYRSILRSEAILSVMLETALLEKETAVINRVDVIPEDGLLIKLPKSK